jgi:hypothetical protein
MAAGSIPAGGAGKSRKPINMVSGFFYGRRSGAGHLALTGDKT